MPAAKSGSVTGIQDNVIFCDFGAAAGARAGLAPDEVLAGIRAAIAEIGAVVSDTLAIQAETSAFERDAAQSLSQALDSMDIVAFQSRILAAGVAEHRDDNTEDVAMTLQRFVAAGLALTGRLNALAAEHKAWIGAESRVLREIAAQVAQLETAAADCIRSMRADPRHSDALG